MISVRVCRQNLLFAVLEEVHNNVKRYQLHNVTEKYQVDGRLLFDVAKATNDASMVLKLKQITNIAMDLNTRVHKSRMLDFTVQRNQNLWQNFHTCVGNN